MRSIQITCIRQYRHADTAALHSPPAVGDGICVATTSSFRLVSLRSGLLLYDPAISALITAVRRQRRNSQQSDRRVTRYCTRSAVDQATLCIADVRTNRTSRFRLPFSCAWLLTTTYPPRRRRKSIHMATSRACHVASCADRLICMPATGWCRVLMACLAVAHLRYYTTAHYSRAFGRCVHV